MEAEVVPVRLDPIDLRHLEERHPPTGANQDAFQSTAFRAQVGQRGEDLLTEACVGAAAPQRRLGARQAVAEALRVERLEKVVEGVHGERLEGVLLVGSDEDDRRQVVGAKRFEHAEAVELGDLDVEEDEVGTERGDPLHGLEPVAALRDHLDLVVLGEQGTDPSPRQRLVVNDDDP